MIKKPMSEPSREGILGSLIRFGRGKVAPPDSDVGKSYVPPSRRNRKSITTWQDEAVLKELKNISYERGIPQQVLIAEGLSYVLARYRKREVGTLAAQYKTAAAAQIRHGKGPFQITVPSGDAILPGLPATSATLRLRGDLLSHLDYIR
jgi:hypothetical protein